MERLLLDPSTRLAGPQVLTLGNLDGVHLGHQALVAATLRRARELGGGAVVLTFEPHPATVLDPAKAPPALTNLEHKLELLGDLGLDRVVVAPFTRDLADMSAEAFVETVLKTALGTAAVIVGPGFRFGRKRSGSAAVLERSGLAVEVVPPVLVAGHAVSSTRVREALARGAVDAAQQLLGRAFVTDTVVVRGEGRGSRIGVPTANLAATGEIVPAEGVYAGWCRLISAEGRPEGRWPAVANVGRRPTFAGRDVQVEAHLLGYSGQLYGRRLRLEYRHRLRAERRFAGADELVRQIRSDIEQARSLLENG